jgi:hypothetical protein
VAIDWTQVIGDLIAALPAVIAALFAVRVHRQVQTPSGKTIGEVAEYAHDTAIANNLLLSKQNGATVEADRETIRHEGESPPQIPSSATEPPQV